MNQKLLNKVLATILAVILTFANFIMLSVYATNSYASEASLENQNIVSNNPNVKFDAYFADEKENKTHTKKQDIDENVKLFLSVQVEKGYLKNAKIKILGKDGKEANFSIIDQNQSLELIENIDVNNNLVALKQINSGTNIVLEIPITSIKTDTFDLSNFSKINDITLIGTYVDNNGKQIEIEKTINTEIEWKKESNVVLEQELKTFLPYEINDKKETILQTIVKVGLENNELPIKQTNIAVKVPEINGKKPEEVIVIANSTKATNGEEAEKFTNQNWNYNKETGTVEIAVSNEPNENKVAWKKDVKDEYVLTYIYSEKVDTIETEQNMILQIEAYNSELTKLEKEDKLNIKEETKKGNIITTEISSISELSKGYLYSNVEKELEYFENIRLNIGYVNLVDKIVVENKQDNYINSKNEETSSASYYKTTTINKENFQTILGEEGYIKIIGKDGERLATITKDTNTDENGNYTYNYTNKLKEIKIETSKPIKEGTLEINHIKSLEGKNTYTRNQISDFQKLQLKLTTDIEYVGTKIESIEKTEDIKLIEPSTKLDVEVSNANLSTIIKNENVKFRVILKTNDISCDLYKNPSVELVLPNYIQEINIKNVDLLFEDELKIKETKAYKNESGNIVIYIKLEGEQTLYSQNEVSKGANIVVNTDITLKTLTPTKEDLVKAYIINELATSYEKTEPTNLRAAVKGYAETSMNAVAPTGLVTTNTMSGYNKNNETVTSISGTQKIGKLDAKSDSKVTKASMSIINNYNNKINNISILGRIPTSGNKDVVTKEDLGSNIDAKIISSVSLNRLIKNNIYYSTNELATKDLNDAKNEWKEEIKDISTIKSYLIVFEDYEMQTGEQIDFEYYFEIPANLEYDKSVYTNYVVYFDNVKATETIKDEQLATKVGLTTGQGPKLEVALKQDIENEKEIQEGSYIKYTAAVKNIGNTTLNKVKVSTNIPEGTTYIRYEGFDGAETTLNKIPDSSVKEYYEIIEELNPGEIRTVEYEVKVQPLFNETEKTIQTQATVTVEGYDAEFKSQTRTNKVIEGYLNIEMDLHGSYGTIKEGQEVTYMTTIKNANMKEKENVVVTNKLPDGVSFVSAGNDGVYDETTNTVTWNIGNIGGEGIRYATLTVKINEMPVGQTRKEILNSMIVKTSEKELKTNELQIVIMKPVMIVNQSTSTNQKVSIGDTIQYNVTLKNLGEVAVTGIVVRDYLPVGLKYRGATYIINGQTYETWIGNVDATINIPLMQPGETIDITINALVDDDEENKKERTIKNIIEVTAQDITKIGSNEVSHIIVEKTESVDPSVDQKVEGTYKISGLAWLDANRNGRRDDEETILSDIEVMLVNSETGKIVADHVTGINKVQTTNKNGAYIFENIEPGKYLVVFFYDTQNYGVTKYKADGVIDTKNSDVVSMKVTLNGETRQAAVANSIQIENEDITNIDMGLTLNSKFDLKLEKTVSKITVNNSKGAKVYEYNDAKLAKIDLEEKTIEGSTIIVEYKIKVTNEGDVAGYVKKIVDYIPSDMTFSAELNQDWYIGESKNAYNASLANTLINPEETKEVTLILTKKMTNENTGTINNVAEIYEASNDFGLKDDDSTPANKVQSEDDISLADVIIGVKTGEVYVYILVTLISITLLGIGIYFINKKVLRKI